MSLVLILAGSVSGRGLSANQYAPESAPKAIKHLVIYHREGRFAGWPANHGAWIWGNEILVGFDAGEFEWRQQGHGIKRTVTPDPLLARSRDGGETWTIKQPADLELPAGVGYQDSCPPGNGRPLTGCPGGLDFQHPNFAFTARMTRNPDVSRFVSD